MKVKKTWSEVIKEAINASLINVHTSLPARVEKYSEGKADVVILIKRNINDEIIEYPKLTDVPVMQPRSNDGKSFLSLPIKKGDTGMVSFIERSIDKWLVNGQSTDPEDARKFDLSDAIFTPGLYPFSKPLKYESKEATELKNDKSQLILWPDGKIELKGNNVDLLSIISDVINHLSSAQIITAMGPSPFFPSTIANFVADQTRLTLIKK